MPLFEKCDKFTLVNEYRKQGIYPYFHELTSAQAPEVEMEGHRCIMLGSNNYLGLTCHKDVKAAAIAAIETYGTGCSGSRFLNGTLDQHILLEKELAAFVGKEAACTFSTGFQSNLGAISAIAARHDYILIDKEDHASIYDGCKLSYAEVLRYNHNDMQSLEELLKSLPLDAGKLIVTDGVFSMSGDTCPLDQIVELKKKYRARLMVDDAHGLGVIGIGGRGTASQFGLTDEVDLIMGTFSKSLASLGGYVAGDYKVIDYIKHNSRPFIFSASIPPASAASARASLKILREHPEMPKRLIALADYLREAFSKRDIPYRPGSGPIVPIYTYDPIRTLKMGRELFDEGVYVNPTLPPATAPNECLLRTSLMATFTEDLLDEAADIIARVYHKEA